MNSVLAIWLLPAWVLIAPIALALIDLARTPAGRSREASYTESLGRPVPPPARA